MAVQRVRLLAGPKVAAAAPAATDGGVVYWMSRDQRAQDNWALLHAQSLAKRYKVGLTVIFCLVPTFHEATVRQYGFMLRGLREVEADLRGLGIPFRVLSGDPVAELPAFVERHRVCAVVGDFSPLRVGRMWKSKVCERLDASVSFYEVDAHNIVPVWVASDKQEVGARTIRKKINDKLPTWLKDIPRLEPQAEPPEPAAGASAESGSATVAPTPTCAESMAASNASPGVGSGGDRQRPAIDEASLAELSASLERAVATEPSNVEAAGTAVEAALAELERVVPPTRAMLSATGAGKAVNNLAKAKGSQFASFSSRARALVEVWRAAAVAEKAADKTGDTPMVTSEGGARAGGGAAAAAAAAIPRHPCASLLAECVQPTDWKALTASLQIDRTVREVDWITPGPSAALDAVRAFGSSRLRLFADKRNDPNSAALSDLSPYLHFGQLSAQRMALMVQELAERQGRAADKAGLESFLEESIVRRELADKSVTGPRSAMPPPPPFEHAPPPRLPLSLARDLCCPSPHSYCYYQPNYDNLAGAAGWARESLELHASDPRPHVYSLAQLEGAKSHEDIWNAAQRQMATTGKMHGFMRMYWAKKILEWSPSPEEALRRANPHPHPHPHPSPFTLHPHPHPSPSPLTLHPHPSPSPSPLTSHLSPLTQARHLPQRQVLDRRARPQRLRRLRLGHHGSARHGMGRACHLWQDPVHEL